MSDLFYLNARIGAMRGELLSRQAYEQILLLPDLPAMITYLRETPYGRSVESVDEAASDVKRAEEAFRRNFSETLVKLFSISTGDCREAIQIFLQYWETQNIKTVLRGKNVRLPASEILPSLIPTGLHDEPALEELCRQPNLRAVIELMVSWHDPYGRILLVALEGYREPRDLFLLETTLDRHYFESAFRKLKQIGPIGPLSSGEDALSVFFGLLVDRTNLMTVLKVVEEQLTLTESDRYFLSGGRVYTLRDFVRLISSHDLQEALQLAAKPPFNAAIKNLQSSLDQPSFLSILERQLDRMILKRVHTMMRVDPLSVATVVSYLLEKIREITNLRLVFRGKLVNLPGSDLMQLLILEY
jgi:V/A-type H+/Na+-transporting ATPase subunit C